MKINIKTNKKLFFRQALEVVRHIPPYNQLRSGELNVLAQLIYYENQYKDLPEDVRGKIIFDYETKQKMRDFIETSEPLFNTTLSTLRRKGFISGRTIKSPINFDIDNPEIIFKFNVEEEEI